MALTDRFVLPSDVVLQPVSGLTEKLRLEIGSEDKEFVLSRPNSRSHSKLITAEAAALIRQFENPSGIAEAVARFSQGKTVDAHRLLEEAWPMLRSLMAARLLVEADSRDAGKILPSLCADNNIDRWAVVRCVRMLEDSEVYQVRSPSGQVAALKIGRTGYGPVGRALAREARILSALDSTVTPRLLGTGEWEGRPYLLIEWLSGVDAQAACDEFRRRADLESYRILLRLTCAILDAYSHLHRQGVIHGDVHPRNILIDSRQAVKIIDLGLARWGRVNGQDDVAPRGGVGFFFEPEYAKAALERATPPLSSFAGEQYGLAAMLYLLWTGSHYVDFSLERNEMLRQIVELQPRPFIERDFPAWPDVEKCLKTALSKNPAARFPSVRDFSGEWHAVDASPLVAAAAHAQETGLRDIRREVLGRFALRGSRIDGKPLTAPTVSLNYGSAGIAYTLYRIACASDNAELMALADVWSVKSVREIGDEGAFYNPDFEMPAEMLLGGNSLYHSPAGVHVVQALIAQTRGDLRLQSAATGAFIEVSKKPGTILDVTLGRAGSLLGCTFLLDALNGGVLTEARAPLRGGLLTLGGDILEELWRQIDGYSPIQESREMSNLGIAHGWAGLLYSTLCWCSAARVPLPRSFPERLEQLSACAEPVGRGVQWRWNFTGEHSMPGWCNGSAGYVFLWTLAHHAIGEMKYLDLAEGAAWNVWETPASISDLCCGMAGQAYALLNFYRHVGDTIWLRRARDAAHTAAVVTVKRGKTVSQALNLLPSQSLYKGELGLAVLDADLENPERARMPMFEREHPVI